MSGQFRTLAMFCILLSVYSGEQECSDKTCVTLLQGLLLSPTPRTGGPTSTMIVMRIYLGYIFATYLEMHCKLEMRELQDEVHKMLLKVEGAVTCDMLVTCL